MRRDWGADELDQPVSVPAAELFEWAWLTAQLANWLYHAADSPRRDFHDWFGDLRSLEHTAALLTQTSERIAALLPADGDRRQP